MARFENNAAHYNAQAEQEMTLDLTAKDPTANMAEPKKEYKPSYVVQLAVSGEDENGNVDHVVLPVLPFFLPMEMVISDNTLKYMSDEEKEVSMGFYNALKAKLESLKPGEKTSVELSVVFTKPKEKKEAPKAKFKTLNFTNL